jgi:hypothetical protein
MFSQSGILPMEEEDPQRPLSETNPAQLRTTDSPLNRGEAKAEAHDGENAHGDEDPSSSDRASRLNRLEAFLRQPDAVMEPGVTERLREYVLAEGHPQQAVEFLTEGYVGELQWGRDAGGGAALHRCL